MSHPANDAWLEGRREWIEEQGAVPDMIETDEDGLEFVEVYVEYENGNPGEDGYDAGKRLEKVYLPDNLQTKYA